MFSRDPRARPRLLLVSNFFVKIESPVIFPPHSTRRTNPASPASIQVRLHAHNYTCGEKQVGKTGKVRTVWLRNGLKNLAAGQDLNLRPPGYEPLCAPFSRSASLAVRRCVYLESICSVLCPVIALISITSKSEFSKKRLVASCRRS